MKRTNLVLRFNDGVVDSFATKEDLVEWFKKEGVSDLQLTSEEGDLIDDEGDGDKYSVEKGVELLMAVGRGGGCVCCWNEELVEMGDDYVEIGVYEITVK